MFQRLHQRDQYSGNGIGLALCKRIIENHNGTINFTSIPGKGTTFWIYLPKN
jgi:signal transduction histidine kinase